MTYEFTCRNEKCEKNLEIVEMNLPMSESSTPKFCPECQERLQRMYNSFGCKTSDGYKTSK